MLIAHIPTGIIITSIIIKKHKVKEENRFLWFSGITSSFLPDVDLFYFYLIDSSQHHHKLFPHIPLFWLCILLPTIIYAEAKKSQLLLLASSLFLLNIFIHLLMDTVAGHIWWLYPFIDHSYVFIKIPNIYQHWILNFIFHWTFIIELMLCITMIYIVRIQQIKSMTPPNSNFM